MDTAAEPGPSPDTAAEAASSPDSASGLALARSHAYELCGSLLLDGLTPALRRYVRELPELAGPAAALADADAAAAEQHRVLGFEVFPYEGVFLGAEPQVGGERAELLHERYAAAGWPEAARQRESPDHLGVELRYLGFLCRREHLALAQGQPDLAGAGPRPLARSFLDAHLLAWLPAFVHALERLAQPFHAALGRLALELALEHRASLGFAPAGSGFPGGQASAGGAAGPEALPCVEPGEGGVHGLLDDPRAGLREIAAFLLTPSRSGLYLSRAELGRLGQALELPAGFGARLEMLQALLRAAVDHGLLPGLVLALRELSGQARDFHAALHPVLPAAGAWLERLDGTRALLDRLARALDEGREAPPPAAG